MFPGDIVKKVFQGGGKNCFQSLSSNMKRTEKCPLDLVVVNCYIESENLNFSILIIDYISKVAGKDYLQLSGSPLFLT